MSIRISSASSLHLNQTTPQTVSGTPIFTTPNLGAPTISGDITFDGAGTGLSYGGCEGLNIAWVQAATSGTWYEVSDDGMSDCVLNNVAHDGSGKLTVTNAGVYLISYNITFESTGAANTHMASAISISGTEQSCGQGHVEISAANKEYQLSGTSVISLAASATVQVSVQYTGVGTPNITVDDLTITVVQVGG